jgi:cytochrome c553
MKNVWFYPLSVMLIGLMFTGRALAAEKPSQVMGRLLFNSPSLAGATSGKSCASCHPAGEGLENAWKNPDLAGQVNTCIAGPLKGLKLNLNSVEMQSLIMYIRSLKQ